MKTKRDFLRLLIFLVTSCLAGPALAGQALQTINIEKDFQNVPAETGALIALLERGEVEAINMFEPHTTRLVMSGKYRVLTDFDIELGQIFGAPPLKSTV